MKAKKHLVVVYRSFADAIERIKNIPFVEHVKVSHLTSLQVDMLDMAPQVGGVILLNVALRYENVAEFLQQQQLPVREVHISQSYTYTPQMEYVNLSVENCRSLDEAIALIEHYVQMAQVFDEYEVIVARNIVANSESSIPVWTTEAERDHVVQEFKDNPELLNACIAQDDWSRRKDWK